MASSLRLLQALDFAAEKHSDQRRKSAGAAPYINHPIRVACLLADVAGVEDETILIAAILHDTLEDTATTPAELEKAFGVEVLAIVKEVTDDKSLPKQVRKRLQVEHAPHLSQGAAIIKLADKISNISDIGVSPPHDWTLQRCEEYLVWAAEVVEQLPPTNQTLQAHFASVMSQAQQHVADRKE